MKRRSTNYPNSSAAQPKQNQASRSPSPIGARGHEKIKLSFIKRAPWGRPAVVRRPTIYGCLLLMVVGPTLVLVLLLTCSQYDGYILHTFHAENLQTKMLETIFNFNRYHVIGYLGWLLIQVLLYLIPDLLDDFLPYYVGGIRNGKVTPTGKVHKYHLNGLQTWLLFVWTFFYFGVYNPHFSPSFVSRNLLGYFTIANITAFLIAIFLYINANYFPTSDSVFSNSYIYDFAMGIEMNPRITQAFDCKIFFHGRAGLLTWALINFSFLMEQMERFGTVSDSMVIVNILHGIYITDFFFNERWYLKTLDVSYDHFGFFFVWNSLVWIPFVNSLQTHYLLYYPVVLGKVRSTLVLIIGLTGYLLYRVSNAQRDGFRNDPENFKISGESPRYLHSLFVAGDGKFHKGFFLLSGLWGKARHINYVGDLIMTFSTSIACRHKHYFPFFSTLFKFLFLCNRTLKDERKLNAKYGVKWEQYKEENYWAAQGVKELHS